MKNILAVAIGLIMLFTTHTAQAQDRLSLEISGGGAFPTQDFGEADLGADFGLEAALAYRFLPRVSGYAGWGWHHFAPDEPFAGADVDVEETGYTFGLRFARPFGALPLRYFVQAGGTYDHIELEDDDEITADSDHGLGWEVGAGVMLPFGNKWHLVPGVRYRSLSRDIDMNGASTEADLSYFTVRVGLSRSF